MSVRCPTCQRRLSAEGACRLHPQVERPPKAPLPPLPRELPEGLTAVAALGAGGGGEVFAVRDRFRDRYALKLSPSSLDAEAAALRALGAPHTPQLYASGRWPQGAWLLMEELHGQTLAQRLAEAPLEPGECLALARRTAELLRVLHGRGICHRDLKPENLWLRASGEVALLDFGLAGAGRAARAGTAHYMSPEQCVDAQAAGPATDLYSLGVVLFEAVAGRPPFTGSADELREAHVHRAAPTLASASVRWPSLEPVLARLLAKEPHQRYRDAGELVLALAQVTTSDVNVEAPPAAAPAAAHARRIALLGVRSARSVKQLLEPVRREGGVLAATALRSFVFAFPEAPTVEAGLAAARRAQAQLGLEPGALSAVHAASAQVRTFASSMRITGAEVTAPAWLEVAAAPAPVEAAPAPRARLVGRDAELAHVEAALAAAPVVVLTGPAGVGKTRLLEAVAARHPELELADDDASHGAPGRGRRLVACRETRDPRLHERPGEVAHVRLEPLGLRDAVALLRELIRPVEFVSDALLERLAAQAHGLPGLLTELARALEVSGDLKADPATGEWRLAPDAALLGSSTPLHEQLAASALAGLPRDHQDVARLCAVLGDGPLERVEAAARHLPPELGAASLDIGRALSRLQRAGLLQLEGARVRFTRRAAADSIERSLAPALRRVLHAAAFEAHERDAEPTPARARHAAAAGRYEAAQADLFVLAERAAAACRDIDAEAHLSAALALPSGGDAERAGWLWRRGRARRRNQRFGEAQADLSLALSLSPAGPLAAELWLERATVADWSEDFAQSRAALEEAERHGPFEGATLLRLELARGRGEVRRGEWERATARLLKVAADASGTEPEVETVARLLAGATAAVLGRLDDSERELGLALESARARGDFVHAGVALSNRVLLWLGRDRLDEAIADLRESVRLAAEWGHPQNERWNSHNLAQFLLWLGRPAEALPLAERAHSLGRRFFGDALPPTATLLLARLRLELKDAEGARALTAALPAQSSAGDAAQAQLLELKLRGERAPGPWLALQPDAAAPVDDQIDLLLEAARGLEHAGHPAQAAERRAQARALLAGGTAAVWRRVL